ncbi:MAG TPA: hypothetical protein PKB11_14825 [Desulfovibrio sp.]|jgi:hypothetical protein|uniref:hypothetical protein n=1 Tax=Desulfovibrio sp. TaxID=885 RepID=UPI002A4C559F|nr:hypothetical protein [Desulfovibrio sp.]MDY0307661.1 hypothetical protein [Desulfovibrionaceae bacterium]HMM40029.1 hypothetical protein [Desulfovibrio sp.]
MRRPARETRPPALRALPVLAVLAVLFQLFSAPAAGAASIDLEDDGSYVWRRGNHYSQDRTLPPDVGKAAFERVMDPAHLVLTGLGPAKDKTLTVDQDGPAEMFAILGRVPRLPDEAPTAPGFGYRSHRPGDATVLLVRADDCPETCDRIYSFELRSDSRGLPLAENLHPSPGLDTNAATASGLRLGMTRDEVKAVLGRPQEELPDALRYCAIRKLFLSVQEVLERGRPEKYAKEWQLLYRCIDVTFRDDRADSIFILHRLTWD